MNFPSAAAAAADSGSQMTRKWMCSSKTQRLALLLARMKQNISSTYLLFDNDTGKTRRRRLSGKNLPERRRRRRSKCNHVLKVLFSAQHNTITARRRLSPSSSQRAARCSFIFPGKTPGERKQTTGATFITSLAAATTSAIFSA